jgi:hypothetical protein
MTSPLLLPEPTLLPEDDSALALLRAGIPLMLVFDLAGSDPHSHELYVEERPDWLTPRQVRAPR